MGQPYYCSTKIIFNDIDIKGRGQAAGHQAEMGGRVLVSALGLQLPRERLGFLRADSDATVHEAAEPGMLL